LQLRLVSVLGSRSHGSLYLGGFETLRRGSRRHRDTGGAKGQLASRYVEVEGTNIHLYGAGRWREVVRMLHGGLCGGIDALALLVECTPTITFHGLVDLGAL
jgi:hypothetical protein